MWPKNAWLNIIYLLFISFGFFGVTHAQELPSLFQPTKDYKMASGFSALPDRIDVDVDFSHLRPSANATVRLSALLPDKVITIIRKKTRTRKNGNYTWLGKVEGYKHSSVVISVVDGVMYGHINLDGDAYFIEPQNGGYLIIKHDVSRVPLFEKDTRVPPLGAGMDRSVRDYSLQEDGSRIDVLVLYTQQMVNRYGSSGVVALIQHFIDLTNEGYMESGVNTELRLVHSELYSKTGVREGVSIGNALDHITNNSNIATIRNDVKADLVTLLRRYESGSCGLAWVMQNVGTTFANHAFSVVEVRSQSEANPYYCDERTLAHEVGHNLGCAHDRDHAGVNGAYDYSYGYDVSGVFGTIMSYDGPSITRFSTPDKKYNGHPLGKDVDDPNAAHNVQTINNTRMAAANFMIAAISAEPDISATPAAYAFGGVRVESTSSAHSFEVTNNGTEDLLLVTASISGPAAPEFTRQNDNCSGQTLGLFETCTIDVVFLPLSQGAKTATLGIPSNDSDNPTLELSLTGEGIPPLAVVPDEGTIGTILNLTGSGFGSRTKVYVEYLYPRTGKIRRKYARILTRSKYAIEARWNKALPPGTYDLFVKPRGRKLLPIAMGEFSIMAPVIDNESTLNGAVGAIVNLSGQYLTTRKPKVYLQNATMLKRKRCRVIAWRMDPETGLSTLEFVVPDLTPGDYQLTLKTKIAEATATFTIN